MTKIPFKVLLIKLAKERDPDKKENKYSFTPAGQSFPPSKKKTSSIISGKCQFTVDTVFTIIHEINRSGSEKNNAFTTNYKIPTYCRVQRAA